MKMKSIITGVIVTVMVITATGCRAKEEQGGTEPIDIVATESHNTETPIADTTTPELEATVEPVSTPEPDAITEPDATTEPEPDTDDEEMIRTYGKWVNEEIDEDTAAFLYGAWVVKALLGFSDHYNDASEYPTGQNIIGDTIIIREDSFSSMGMEGYPAHQYDLANPYYEIEQIFYNNDAFYRTYRTSLDEIPYDTVIKTIKVTAPNAAMTTVSFFVVNDDRLFFSIEAAYFELQRVVE